MSWAVACAAGRALANKASAVVDEVAKSGKPAVVTKRGKPIAAVVPIDPEALARVHIVNGPIQPYLLGGAVYTEVVFSWPGIGLQLYSSIVARDIPMVQATVLLVGLGFVLVWMWLPRAFRPVRRISLLTRFFAGVVSAVIFVWAMIAASWSDPFWLR